MLQENRTRPIRKVFRVTEHENDVIMRRMALAKTKRQSDFLRKQAMDGMIINVDYSQIKELLMHIGRVSSNINQIAKRYNSTGRFYQEDIEDIKENQEKIIKSIHALERKLI
jgi:(p)ppGpp synthase/HD superfamily hydrolase